MTKGRTFFGLLLSLILLASPAWAARYVDNGDGTVTDTRTKLIWQQTADGVQRTWEDAVAYCENLSLASRSDWRLPNFRALQSIVDDTTFEPAMDPVFVGGWDMEYWSSTTVTNDPASAWAVAFANGNSRTGIKGIHYPYYYTRCVTGGH